MKEQGVVSRIISPQLAEVAFQRNEACAKCRLCHDVGENMVAIEAVNEVGARRDDVVEIEIPSGEIVKGSIVVFLIPIFFLVAGYLLGSYFMRLIGLQGWEERAGIVAGILAMFLSYFAIKYYDENIQQKEVLRAKIVRIVSTLTRPA
jgi:sigma-E factor negative regulatory protein RseC